MHLILVLHTLDMTLQHLTLVTLNDPSLPACSFKQDQNYMNYTTLVNYKLNQLISSIYIYKYMTEQYPKDISLVSYI